MNVNFNDLIEPTKNPILEVPMCEHVSEAIVVWIHVFVVFSREKVQKLGNSVIVTIVFVIWCFVNL